MRRLRGGFCGDIEDTSNDTVLDFLLSLDHFAVSCQGYEVIGVFQFLDARNRAEPAYCLGKFLFLSVHRRLTDRGRDVVEATADRQSGKILSNRHHHADDEFRIVVNVLMKGSVHDIVGEDQRCLGMFRGGLQFECRLKFDFHFLSFLDIAAAVLARARVGIRASGAAVLLLGIRLKVATLEHSLSGRLQLDTPR
jgi:hypothetical protein